MKKGLRHILLILAVIVLAVFLIYRAFGTILPGLIEALRTGNEKQVEKYLAQSSTWDGMFCVLLLQFLQVVTVVFPGWPIQVAAGIVYGSIHAFFLCFLGFWGGNITVFYVIRKLKNSMGKKKNAEAGSNSLPESGSESGDIPDQFKFPEEKKKLTIIEKLKSTHPAVAVMIGVLLPGMPNGFVPYVAAGTGMSFKAFALATAAGSFVPILTTCMAGHFLMKGNWILSVLAVLIPLALVFVIYLNQYKIIQFMELTERKKKKHL